MRFVAPLSLLHFGATDEERKDALKRMQVEQIEGRPNHGMFVAKDALAQLKGILPGNAEAKIRTIIDTPIYPAPTR